jgi:hypothetical protein
MRDYVLTLMILSALFGFCLGKGYGPVMWRVLTFPVRLLRKKPA